MSARTYYIRRDGSATSTKPWSMDYVTTVRASSIKDAESRLPFLTSRDLFAEFSFGPTYQRVVFCNIETLRAKRMNDKIYPCHSRMWRSNDRLEIIGISPQHLESELLGYARKILDAKKTGLTIKLLHGALAPGFPECLGPYRIDVSAHRPDPARLKQMKRVEAFMRRHLQSKGVVIHRPGPWWQEDGHAA